MWCRIRSMVRPVVLLMLLGLGPPGTGHAAGQPPDDLTCHPSAWTVADLFASPVPYAVGHRGYGANLGEDPNRPIENTLDAFRQAFRDGIRVVELDLQRTADGKIVVFHDDFLEDFACVSSLTYGQLLARRPQVPLFRAVLNSSRHFSNDDDLSGIILAEIKVPVPLCDGANTSELAAVSEAALVRAVVEDIRRARMEDQVILNAGSPSILRQALAQAPEIKRALSLNILQLLTPQEVQVITGLPVVEIPKNDCGLKWYNVGPIARLPAMPGADFMQRFGSFLGVTIGCDRAQAVSLDMRILQQAGGAAPNLVAAVHGQGLEAIAWTIENQAEWDFLARAGVDGITTNNIPVGLSSQAPLPGTLARGGVARGRSARGASAVEVIEPALALRSIGSNPSRDGTVHVELALPGSGPARLELIDLAGRRVETREVGSFGPGRHVFALGRDLSPGIYLVRLAHERGEARAKVAVTQ